MRARAEQRVRWWFSPKLGRLHHHPPEALRVPRSYLRARPPQPAPTITIVTPSFRQGRFLGRTIESVLDQRYPALEYVVQDGGSDDGSVEVIRRYERALARWESRPDEGQGSAINLGFAGTSGEVMAWLNSDDVLMPGALAYVARYLVDHPEVDAVYGDRLLIDEHGRKVGSWVLPPHDDRALRLIDFVPQETLFWRRGLWERCGGGVDEELRFAVDWELLLRFAAAGAQIVHLRRFVAGFRVHEEQKTSAQHELGMAESDRLRERALGKPVPHAEAMRLVGPYLRRHVPLHILQRARDRLPVPRVEVEARPLEPLSS
jgi:glycosyltransferase involved in cell wall biosynthesis